MKSLIAALVVTGAMAAAAAPSAHAFSLTETTVTQAANPNLIAVRDGCGFDRHFAPGLGRCVFNGPRFWWHNRFWHHERGERFYRY